MGDKALLHNPLAGWLRVLCCGCLYPGCACCGAWACRSYRRVQFRCFEVNCTIVMLFFFPGFLQKIMLWTIQLGDRSLWAGTDQQLCVACHLRASPGEDAVVFGCPELRTNLGLQFREEWMGGYTKFKDQSLSCWTCALYFSLLLNVVSSRLLCYHRFLTTIFLTSLFS